MVIMSSVRVFSGSLLTVAFEPWIVVTSLRREIRPREGEHTRNEWINGNFLCVGLRKLLTNTLLTLELKENQI